MSDNKPTMNCDECPHDNCNRKVAKTEVSDDVLYDLAEVFKVDGNDRQRRIGRGQSGRGGDDVHVDGVHIQVIHLESGLFRAGQVRRTAEGRRRSLQTSRLHGQQRKIKWN